MGQNTPKFKKEINYDPYGVEVNIIHFKFGHMWKRYNFTDEFVDKYKGFVSEYKKYFEAKGEGVFKSSFEVLHYIDVMELPVILYYNLTDQEFETTQDAYLYLQRSYRPYYMKIEDGKLIGLEV